MTFSLRYPNKVILENTSYLAVKVKEKVPTPFPETILGGVDVSNLNESFDDTGNTEVMGENKSKFKGQILLPLPQGMAESNAVRWADSTFNQLEQFGASKALDIMGSGGGDLGEMISNIGNSAETALVELGQVLQNDSVNSAVKKAITANILKQFGSNVSASKLFSRTTGQILNPYLELLFDGVTLRNHSFSFKLTPRSRDEAVMVKRIINMFKRSMAARNDASGPAGLFIKNPDVFELEFKKGSKKHPYLYSMKTCGLKNMDVNYSDSSSQSYASYYDGSPVSLTLKLDFTELTPVYNEDYNDKYSDELLEEGPGF